MSRSAVCLGGEHHGQLAVGDNVGRDEDKVVADNVVAVNLAKGVAQGARARRRQRAHGHCPPAAAEARLFNVRLVQVGWLGGGERQFEAGS